MTNLRTLLLLLITLTSGATASSQSSLDNPEDQNTSQDCSDPMTAGSLACTQRSQTSTQPNRTTQLGGTNEIVPQGAPSSNLTYRDNDDLTSRLRNRNQPTRPLPPEPLSEFQKFVASATGEVLPVFGADLFRNVPSTFAPVDLTPVPADYVIGPGDEIRIRVWGQVNFRADLRVDRSGEIYVPQAGGIHVAGLHFSELDQHLRSAIGRIYRNFDLTADLGQMRAIQVYMTGQARRPGVYTVGSLSTLADAIFACGGASVEGSLRHIQLRREGAVVTDFDLYALLLRGEKSKDVKLLSEDVIYIPAVGSQVAITGSVRNPGIYELLSGETIGDALKDAGGASTVASESRISLDRLDDHQSRRAMEAAFDAAGLATPLGDGDILRILSIVPMYSKTVTLRGNTANPGRFEWHAGMRLSDLIPDRDALITRDYWWRRAQLGLPAPEFEPLERFPTLYQPSTPFELRSLQRSRGMYPNGTPYVPPGYPGSGYPGYGYPGYAYPGTGYPGQGYPGQGYPGWSYPGWGYPATAQQGVRESSPGYAPEYGPGYEGNNEQNWPPEQSTSDSGSQGQGASQQANSAIASARVNTQNTSAPAPRNYVRLSAPEIDWDYAVIQRMDVQTLKNSLMPFDLGKLVLQHDASQNLELQPGDVVTIFSQADIRVPLMQQTKYVRLEGEFVHAGVYSVQPGESLRDLVERAGGLTSNAYLYGSEFTRESTRLAQQRRIQEYVRNLQVQVQRGNLALAAASPQDVASGVAAQNSEQEIIARLQQIRATGRIVLELQSGSNGVGALPDLALEDGDQFVVPPSPATVNVVGAVYDQNSFLYKHDRRAGNYLQLAGGPDRSADSKHSFIIRADGSVISKPGQSGLWGNTFESLRMNPGDTIVVPEKTIKPSPLRGVLEWSQLFSQLALGAAAINAIH